MSPRIIVMALLMAIVSVAAYVVIKKRLYSQALLAIAGLAGLACGIAGMLKLTDEMDRNDIVGAILIGIGILAVLAVGVIIKMVFPRMNTANQEVDDIGTNRAESSP